MGWLSIARAPGKNRFPYAALLAAALCAAPPAQARGPHKMTEDDLRRVSAQGLAERYFDHTSRYATNGFAVDVLGDLASLLNPLAPYFVGLVDGHTTFRNAVFNPVFPSMLIDADGSALIRMPVSAGEVSVRHLHVRGSNGSSFGSVTIRDLSLNGNTLRIKRH